MPAGQAGDNSLFMGQLKKRKKNFGEPLLVVTDTARLTGDPGC